MEEKPLRIIILISLISILSSLTAWVLINYLSSDRYYIYFLVLVVLNLGMTLGIHVQQEGEVKGFSLKRYLLGLMAIIFASLLLYLQLNALGALGMLVAPFISLLTYQVGLMMIYRTDRTWVAILLNQFFWLVWIVYSFLFAKHGSITYSNLFLGLFLTMTFVFPLIVRKSSV